jgi:peptide-methionine (S)-S-oxide reductase
MRSRASRLVYSIVAIGIGVLGIFEGVVMAEESPLKKAVFAGGCFWCMEPAFEKTPGVTAAVSGYAGGKRANPTYEQVSAGATGHTEVVEISYDPSKVSYAQLLEVFWRNIDPTTPNRQFCDIGTQYRSAIFYGSEEEKNLAVASRKKVEEEYGHNVVTEITALDAFYPAEEYHQDFYKKNPDHYNRYRLGCGRDKRLEELWGKKK